MGKSLLNTSSLRYLKQLEIPYLGKAGLAWINQASQTKVRKRVKIKNRCSTESEIPEA